MKSTSAALFALAFAAAACTPATVSNPGPVSNPDPNAPEGAAAPLPPVPLVTGPLETKVVHPPENHLIGARDSTFIFGSVGNGNATLTVNGAQVKVHPNGGWLAWLPVPPRERPSYELVVALGADTVRRSHPVRVLPPAAAPLALSGPLPADTPSLAPMAGLLMRDDENVRVAISAPANATAWVTFDGGLQTLTATSPERFQTDVPASLLRRGGTIFVARGRDTLRYRVPAVAAIPSQPYVQLGEASPGEMDRTIVGRPTPGGTYRYFFTPGTVVQLTGRQGAFARVRLDENLEVWVDSSDVRILEQDRQPPTANRALVAGNIRVAATPEYSDVRIAIGAPVPYFLQESEDGYRLTLYNTVANSDNINYLAARDPVVRRIESRQETSDRAVYTISTRHAPYGYLVFHDGNTMVVRLRRQPTIDATAPLRGLTIVVDPGHPPGGATGPTGLWEAEAVLAIGRDLQRILTERGANVVMTRTTMDPVALGDRPIMARKANGHAFVSLHLDALPDGANPFILQGTGTYFYRMHSEPLARAVQRGMVRQMGIRDRGVYSANFAVIRNTWVPAVLTEGGFLMIPEQEAAFRNPSFQERYARGVADGLEAYFRGLARAGSESAGF